MGLRARVYSSVVEHLFSMFEALTSISSTGKKKKKRKRNPDHNYG
jgi:hypothetical protein